MDSEPAGISDHSVSAKPQTLAESRFKVSLWMYLVGGGLIGLVIVGWMLFSPQTEHIPPTQENITGSDTPTPGIPQTGTSARNQEEEIRRLRSPELKMQLAFPVSWADPKTSSVQNRPQITLDNRIKISRGVVVSRIVQKELVLEELLLEQQFPTQVHMATSYALDTWQGTRFIYIDEQDRLHVKIFLAAAPQSTDIVIIEYPLPLNAEDEFVILKVLDLLNIEN